MALSRILPPTNFFIFAILELIAHFAMPITQLISGPVRWSGIVLILGGAWFTFAADRLFKQVQTTVKPHEAPSVLVRDGPFKVSRNPMYLGMLLALLGEAVVLGSLTPFLAPIAFFLAVDTVYVGIEEKLMLEAFGEEYSAYKKKVRRWV